MLDDELDQMFNSKSDSFRTPNGSKSYPKLWKQGSLD
jgi:hypothetical protein